MVEQKKTKKLLGIKKIRVKYGFTRYGMSKLMGKFGFTSEDTYDLPKWDFMLQEALSRFYDYNHLKKTFSVKPEFSTVCPKVTLGSICIQLGISRFRLRGILKSNGLNLKDPNLVGQIDQILKNKEGEFSVAAACRCYGLSRYKVTRILKKQLLCKPYMLTIKHFGDLISQKIHE